ncbi:MAG: tryptophan--tRNA ligase, partial [Crocinitomicaceae bacterium]
EPLESPKNPDKCTIFSLFCLLADDESISNMRQSYEKGGYGYGHAKQALFELIIKKFKTERSNFNHLMENRHEIDEALSIGAEKARKVAHDVLKRVRKKVGYGQD